MNYKKSGQSLFVEKCCQIRAWSNSLDRMSIVRDLQKQPIIRISINHEDKNLSIFLSLFLAGVNKIEKKKKHAWRETVYDDR